MTTSTPAEKAARRAKHNYTISARHKAKATPETGPIKISDRDGLYLRVAVNGSKTWHLAYSFGGKQRTYRIGDYPMVDLDDARDIAHDRRKLIAAGIDPAMHDEHQRIKNITAAADTLWSICESWLDHRAGTWSKRTGDRARQFLERYVRDGLGKLPIRDINAGHVHDLLTGIAKGKIRTGKERREGAPSVALAVRQMLNEVWRHAIGTARAKENPVAMMRAGDVVKKPKTKHNKALNDVELRRILQAVEGATLLPNSRAAVRLLFLTAVRTGELIAARWSEFNFDDGVWSIPAERMKSRLPHVVPLSVQAVRILREHKLMTGGSEWVFPNYRDGKRHMGNTTLNNVFVRLGFVDDAWFRGHGCRGSFSTWANENDWPVDHVERSLAHVERNAVRASYNAARWLPQRRALMQAWADHLDSVAHGEQPAEAAA